MYKYWIGSERDGTFSVYRKAVGDPSQDSGFLAGDFITRRSAQKYIDREKEFDASDFGREFNLALREEDFE